MINRPSMKHQPNRKWPLFPYEPYSQQLEFMEDINHVVGNQKILVAEACNGFGKTACALASILPMGHRIIYATRTHEQVRQVLLEIEHINQNSEYKYKAVNLASRQYLCLNDDCKKQNSIDALETCRILRESKECKYRTDAGQLPNLPPVLSITTLQGEGKNRGICPYFLARKAAEDSTVIVAPYQYVFNEHIRSLAKLELSDKILVFDEAHNADQIGQEVLSDSLSERTLNSSKKELDAVNVPFGFIDDLLAYLERKISEEVLVESGTKLYKDIKSVLQVESLASLVDPLSETIDEIRQYKVEHGEYPICYLKGLISFLSLLESSPSDSYIAIYQKSFNNYNLVEYRCLDPSLAIKPVVEEAYGALIMSGTLSPLEIFTELLGLEEVETRSYSSIANPENVRTIIDPFVTTRFTERNNDMIIHIGERLSKHVTKIPNGVLIFFPQRKLMLDALTAWRKKGLLRESGNHCFLEKKTVYVEGVRAIENRKIVEEYKIETKSERGAVLFGVFRGRNAEGSNFPYEEARGVVLVGIPYADYGDPVIKAQINFFNRKRRDLGDRWYVMDAFRAVNQAIGRGIRHRDDWCNFILMDQRYQTHQKLLSNWAIGKGIQTVPSSY
ncbi:MAG: helicase C-terminal domain-containing protein [Candidatus Bathyarchaeota archaeon]